MGRLILTMHVSADGFIATSGRSLWPGFGWPPVVQGRLNDVYRQAGMVIYGRGIYDAVVPWWLAVACGGPDGEDVGEEGRQFAHTLAKMPKVVVSSTMPEPEDAVRVIREDVVSAVTDLVLGEARDVILLAGGRLASDLLRAGLVTDIVLIVGAVMIGAGRPLLEDLDTQTELELIEAVAYPPTTTWLRYRVR